MPDFGSAKNPVDMTGMAGNDWYYETVKYAFAHQWGLNSRNSVEEMIKEDGIQAVVIATPHLQHYSDAF